MSLMQSARLDAEEGVFTPSPEILPRGNIAADGHTDDPVRLYLREIGRHALLTPGEEVELGKQLDRARAALHGALIACPLAVDRIVETLEPLTRRALQVGEIVDLVRLGGDDDDGDGAEAETIEASDETQDATAETPAGEGEAAAPTSQMEPLRLQVIEALEGVAALHAETRGNFGPCDARVQTKLREMPLATGLWRRLSEELRDLNRRLVGIDGRLARLATGAGVSREAFLEAYLGREEEDGWLATLAAKSPAWKKLQTKSAEQVEDLRAELREVGRTAGLPLAGFREIARELERALREYERTKERFARSNLRLVASMARKFAGRGLAFMDLVQEGNIGLMTAIDKYDWRRGFKFSTYASWWIRQSMTRAMADQGRTIRLPVHAVEALSKIHRTAQQLRARTGREPAPEDIAEALALPVDKVRGLMRSGAALVSLDAPVNDEEDSASYGDFLSDDSDTPFDTAAGSALRGLVTEALGRLTDREADVLRRRFGLLGTEETLEEIGATYRVTRERVRQIEAKALRKLAHPKHAKPLRTFLG
ncbi:sigma-70 family RNA polymerase sigma factor [Arenibaculum pallidiluteum]|uniref:sigma-70 family RNA polymerase sigma factor n=1 Tax=Arenibaculum pallidiluteum TaxID=2812559 RepID=UPI001A95DE49|nr:sigma-70 family RNA polymerase sigma factor [Arenibaculum pallidiluteum]